MGSNVNIINIYSPPANKDIDSREEEICQFYSRVGSLMEKMEDSGELIIIGGDWNSVTRNGDRCTWDPIGGWTPRNINHHDLCNREAIKLEARVNAVDPRW